NRRREMRTLTTGLTATALLILLAGCEQQSEPERPVTAPGGEMAPLEVEPATDPADENLNLYQPGGTQQPAASAPQAVETERQEEVLITPDPTRPDNSGGESGGDSSGNPGANRDDSSAPGSPEQGGGAAAPAN